MFTALIAIIGTILCVLMFKGAHNILVSNPVKGLDYHKIRDNEMEIWGWHFTELQCKSNCKKCKALKSAPKTVKELKPPKGPGAGSPKSTPVIMTRHCGICDTRLHTNQNTCQKCTHQILKERRYRRENEYKKARADAPRERQVDFMGVRYRAIVPSEVPNNAHLQIVNELSGFGVWAHWKWTDEKTGKQMGLRSTAHQMERYEVMSYESNKPVKTFYAPCDPCDDLQESRMDWGNK